MSFFQIIESYESSVIEDHLKSITESDILASLSRNRLSEMDFLNLLSEKAQPFIEIMAQKANQLTIQNFGKTIQLYIPLYIANYCTNECIYCGFNRHNKFPRVKLSLEEISQNAIEISKTGIRSILFLTGEAKPITPMSYMLDTVEILKKHFSSINIEVYPLELEEYRTLKNAGVDGLTIYQEAYDRKVYDSVHLSGEKKNYRFRLETPERGAEAGFRTIGIGPLYGLGEPTREAFLTGLHAKYLQDHYPQTDVSVSFPRINEAEGGFKANYTLNDRRFVQFMLAFRLFMPRIGITMSTRECSSFRDNLIPLGITKMSAGSNTHVGGYTIEEDPSKPQFEISDNRSAGEIAQAIINQGYEPVYKDWDTL